MIRDLATPHRYQAYGLSIDSTFPLPELTSRASVAVQEAIVMVRSGPVPEVPGDAVHIGENDKGNWARGSEIWLSCEGSCRLYVCEGREIVAEGEPGADELLRLYVLGVGLGVLLHQRGLLSLHGGAVAIDGAAVAFLGFSGAGKSTMTAALQARGHAVVADDVTAVDLSDPARPMVHPGFPQLKLTPESAQALGYDLASLSKIHASHPKYSFPAPEGLASGRMPLAAVYILAEGDTLGLDALDPQSALVELIRHTYTAGLLEFGEGVAAHLRQCAALVASARVRRLRRPLNLTALPDVAALVERDCAIAAAERGDAKKER